MLFTDTDSLVYEIKIEEIYEDFYQDKSFFYFSNYPLDSVELHSKFFDAVNEEAIGKMKGEFKGKISSEFVGLKSKMYSLISVDEEEVTKAKRVNKNVVKKIKHKELVNYLFNKKVIRHNMKRIQSKLQRIGTCDVCKILLSCFDDKRYILDSLAYFHKDIKD